MQPTYFASFLLAGSGPGPSLPEALRVVEQWIFGNPRRGLSKPPNWAFTKMEPIAFPGGDVVNTVVTEAEDGSQAAAARFEHPDDEARRTWRSDCVLSRGATAGSRIAPLRFSVTVAVRSAHGGLSPVATPRTSPRIVRMMLDTFGGRENFPLKTTFVHIAHGEEERFLEFLMHPDRTLPIVFVSRRNRDDDVMVDLSALASKLAGLTYVCVADSPDVSRTMAGLIDNQLNTYDGAVRVYWPQMTGDDSPFRHRLWTPSRIAALQGWGRRLDDEVLALVARMSVTRFMDGVTRWEDVERLRATAVLREYRDRQRSGQDAEELLAFADDEIRRLTEELNNAQKALEQASTERQNKEEEAQQWRELYIGQLRRSQVQTGSEDTAIDDAAIDDAKIALEMAKRDFAGRIKFIENRIHRETYEFGQPELLYAALKWLATDYLNARRGERRSENLDAECRAVSRFFYRQSQSPVTMGQYWDDYHVSYEERNVALEEHIGFGTRTEPRHSIRIAFFYDGTLRQVVIGYVGQHQQNRRSN